MLLEKISKGVICAGFGLAVLCSSCDSIDGQPIGRMGSYASATMATSFQGLKDLGQHSSSSEGNGQVYCCRCGHIDIAHLRKSADWTRYLGEKSYSHLMNNDAKFSFSFKEPSQYFVSIDYPKNWGSLKSEDKEKISKEVSVGLGQYFSYTGVTWHEMLTWFGYKSTGFYTEFPSAFSWEDGFPKNYGIHKKRGCRKI
ncbi:MAG: DUF4056 domain-containing protein [Candidatus Nanoarchaeia archaeon]|nr:DUF4056 domain-containing protein [Candidatus Nanoarchaeia archaeon]MDD5740505.1 DUF4056 domain-containing protein [Candidatus Nanoarchaeia archaeon]